MNQRQEDIEKHFLNIEFDDEHLPVWALRRSLLEIIKKNLHIFHGNMLDVGCGLMPYRELIIDKNKKVKKYIGLDLAASDLHNTGIADIFWDGKIIPLADAAIDSAMATEVLEHSFHPEDTLREIARVLKPGGDFFCTVPFIWPLHEVPYDAYRYTPFSLKMHLENAGFTEVKIGSLGGWDAAMAQMFGLWISEGSFSPRQKKWGVRVAKKLIPWLLKRDFKDDRFGHHSMYTGLYATSIKSAT